MESVDMRQTAGNFINHVISNLIFPLEDQEHIMVNGNVDWCLDWWVIEIGKYFFEGEEAYMRYPIARRLEGSKNFDKELIRKACRKRQSFLNDMKVSSSDTLIVDEFCRGFDTTLAMWIKEWKKAYVIIQSSMPDVISKTTTYLKLKFPTVEIVPSTFGILGNPFIMSSTGFEGGA